MARGLAALALWSAVVLAPTPAALAEEWGGIEPGVSTIEQVRARFGAPSKESRGKVDSYDTIQWVYEGARAPAGIHKMTVDYGLLTPQGYKQTVVRLLSLEPKARVFGKNTVVQGFGLPDGTSNQNGRDTYFYRSGLIVTFNPEGSEAVLLSFTPPQASAPPSGAPAAPKR